MNKEEPQIEDQIDLIGLFIIFWTGKKLILKLIILFSILGVIIALSRPIVYTVEVTFILKSSQDSPNGSLSSIASLAGINLSGNGNSNSQISPNLYPMIVKSNPFLKDLSNVKVLHNSDSITLYEYINVATNFNLLSEFKKYTLGLPSLVMKLFNQRKNNTVYPVARSILRMSLEEERVYKAISSKINVNVDSKEGVITLKVTEKEPEIAALIVANAQTLLQKVIINVKVKNARELLYFTEKLYSQKRVEFEGLQDELASFKDQHQDISSSLLQNKLNRLESDFQIISSVNEELAKQVEQARIQVSKDKPIFTVINPVVVPNQRTSPNRVKIVVTSIIFSLILGFLFLLIKEPIKSMKNEFLERGK